MIKTAEELELEAVRLKARIKEVEQVRTDELWPTYYSAQIALARNSMDAMSRILMICRNDKVKAIDRVKAITQTEIASLIKLISDLEDEEGGK